MLCFEVSHIFKKMTELPVEMVFNFFFSVILAATQEKYEKQLSELSGRGRCDSTLEEGDITHTLSETETLEQESENQGNYDSNVSAYAKKQNLIWLYCLFVPDLVRNFKDRTV